MKLYAYCLAEDLGAVECLPPGISGARVRLLSIADLTVLVSDSEDDSVLVTRENALAHAAVVRSVLERTTPLPFRFGTLVTEQQLRSYITIRKPALESKLAHVRGCVEMSVKIIWDIPKDTEAKQSEQPPDGTAFLAAKRRQILGDERTAAEAANLSTWLQQQVRGLTRDEQTTVLPSEKLVLSAAHLVERAGIAVYREKIARARENRPDLHFLVSGPWPPYSFANIELEFKSQFGVS
jgi:hypothetical protein